MNRYYSLKDAAASLGVSYSKLWHVFAYGKLPWPSRVGKTLVLAPEDLAALKTFFASVPLHEERTASTLDPPSNHRLFRDLQFGSQLVYWDEFFAFQACDRLAY